MLISFDNSSGYGLPLSNLQVVPDDWNSLIFIISARVVKGVPKRLKCIKENAAIIQPVFFFFKRIDHDCLKSGDNISFVVEKTYHILHKRNSMELDRLSWFHEKDFTFCILYK